MPPCFGFLGTVDERRHRDRGSREQRRAWQCGQEPDKYTSSYKAPRQSVRGPCNVGAKSSPLTPGPAHLWIVLSESLESSRKEVPDNGSSLGAVKCWVQVSTIVGLQADRVQRCLHLGESGGLNELTGAC